MANLTVRLRVAFNNQHVQRRFIDTLDRLSTLSDSQPWNDELRECVEELADVAESLKAVPANAPAQHEDDSSRS